MCFIAADVSSLVHLDISGHFVSNRPEMLCIWLSTHWMFGGPRFISASLSDHYFLPQLVGTPWDHISCGCYGEVASWCLCIVSMSENTVRKPSVSIWVWHVLLIRIYFGGNFSGLGPLTTLFLGAMYSISADIRNMKQLVGSLVSVSVAFSVSTQEPIGKGCCNNFAAWGPSQIERKWVL